MLARRRSPAAHRAIVSHDRALVRIACTRLDAPATRAQTGRMPLASRPLIRRAVALRALAGGRSPSWLRPQLRALRRIVFAKPSRPR